MNQKFLQQLTEFIFVEDLPEKSDIILSPAAASLSLEKKRPAFITGIMLPVFCLPDGTAF